MTYKWIICQQFLLGYRIYLITENTKINNNNKQKKKKKGPPSKAKFICFSLSKE